MIFRVSIPVLGKILRDKSPEKALVGFPEKGRRNSKRPTLVSISPCFGRLKSFYKYPVN